MDKVRELLEDGARIDEAKDDGTSALHSAAKMGHTKVVQLLLEEGTWTEATGNSSATSLIMAASMGHHGTVKALLDRGANPDTAHNNGKATAMYFAAEVGRDEVVRELCARGANVEAEKVKYLTLIEFVEKIRINALSICFAGDWRNCSAFSS